METAVVIRGHSYIRTGLAAGDSNEAEWLALIHAAEIAIDLALNDVVFVGDSSLVINQARGTWKCRSSAFMICQAQFRALEQRLPQISLRHVPRSKNLAGIALQRRYTGLHQI